MKGDAVECNQHVSSDLIRQLGNTASQSLALGLTGYIISLWNPEHAGGIYSMYNACRSTR